MVWLSCLLAVTLFAAENEFAPLYNCVVPRPGLPCQREFEDGGSWQVPESWDWHWTFCLHPARTWKWLWMIGERASKLSDNSFVGCTTKPALFPAACTCMTIADTSFICSGPQQLCMFKYLYFSRQEPLWILFSRSWNIGSVINLLSFAFGNAVWVLHVTDFYSGFQSPEYFTCDHLSQHQIVSESFSQLVSRLTQFLYCMLTRHEIQWHLFSHSMILLQKYS